MSYKIDLGAWGSVFAVPSTLVDTHIKLASESQLKVLLYILRNSGEDISAESISKAVSVHIDEVDNAVSFWIERGLIVSQDGTLTAKSAVRPEEKQFEDTESIKSSFEHKKRTARKQRPDLLFVARRLNEDKQLSQLMDEAQIALSKPLSSGDTATLVMLHDTDGLPCDVLALLINYCVSIGKGNIRSIERIGLQWCDEGINNIALAEEKIKLMSQSNNAWAKVSKLLGIRNIGSPTKTQLSLANCWLNEWEFSDDMILEAYERCVNTKGEYNIKYINAILSKWYSASVFNLEDLKKHDEKQIKHKKQSDKKSKPDSRKKSSYDIDSYENYSLFDD